MAVIAIFRIRSRTGVCILFDFLVFCRGCMVYFELPLVLVSHYVPEIFFKQSSIERRYIKRVLRQSQYSLCTWKFHPLSLIYLVYRFLSSFIVFHFRVTTLFVHSRWLRIKKIKSGGLALFHRSTWDNKNLYIKPLCRRSRYGESDLVEKH